MPAGEVISSAKKYKKDFSKINKYELTQKGEALAVLGLGSFYKLGEEVVALYKEKMGKEATLINPFYISGVDEELMEELKKAHSLVITLEDGVLDGGFGEKITR